MLGRRPCLATRGSENVQVIIWGIGMGVFNTIQIRVWGMYEGIVYYTDKSMGYVWE